VVTDPVYRHQPYLVKKASRFLIERMYEEAKVPTKGSPQAAGYDLYSTEDVVLQPWQRVCMPLGIKAGDFGSGFIVCLLLQYTL